MPFWSQDYQFFENLKVILSPHGVNLLKSMLEINPDKRISAIEAINHPFFKDINLKD